MPGRLDSLIVDIIIFSPLFILFRLFVRAAFRRSHPAESAFRNFYRLSPRFYDALKRFVHYRMNNAAVMPLVYLLHQTPMLP